MLSAMHLCLLSVCVYDLLADGEGQWTCDDWVVGRITR